MRLTRSWLILINLKNRHFDDWIFRLWAHIHLKFKFGELLGALPLCLRACYFYGSHHYSVSSLIFLQYRSPDRYCCSGLSSRQSWRQNFERWLLVWTHLQEEILFLSTTWSNLSAQLLMTEEVSHPRAVVFDSFNHEIRRNRNSFSSTCFGFLTIVYNRS